ncbi:MAG TPA: transglutaminaseTgpA domain-containing protein [Jatrophihabitans sp.]|nr:transglutaminaseTgpA domain-containing protein [Jatrophihabitans sp.]
MTATQQRGAQQRPAQQRPAQQPPGGRSAPALVAATGTVAAGMFLTALPLSSIFTDWHWLTVSIGCSLPYLVIVSGLRYRGTTRWWHSLVGLAASVLMLLWVFVPQHLYFGVLPTRATGGDLGDLVDQARQIMQSEHAPLASTTPTRLLVATALVALLCLTDVLGVLLRQPLLAAAPLLEVLAVASATSSRSANPFWFAAAAAGFLLILLAGTRLQDLAWGPSVDGSAGRLGGGRRMAITGILAALIVPLLLPAVPTNLLARAAHHNGNGSGPGNGSGQVVLNDLASLRGSLQRPTPTTLFQVHVATGDEPFYIRQVVDDRFTNDGWQPTDGDTAPGIPLSQARYPAEPESGPATDVRSFPMDATFTIQALGGHTLPFLADPQLLRVGGGNWDSRTATVTGVTLKRAMTYTESVRQPAPTVDQLRAAPAFSGTGDPQLDERYLQLPVQPAVVTDLAARLVTGQATPYDKARAISDYFTNGKNGFVYSLSAPPTDGNSALVTFLTKKEGFCQQYAAAAAVLMRAVGLPSRVVLGYTHRPPDGNGLFTVTTADAHAWVEVYFAGIGWIPFDPTPLTGPDVTREVALPWAAHPDQSASNTAEPTAHPTVSTASAGASTSTAAPAATASGPAVPPLVWEVGIPVLAVLLLLAGVALGPRGVRHRQRRRRLDRARATGNPELLWLELAATAADRNALWPRTMTVGQVPLWLGRHGVDERGQAAVGVIAGSVERDRFSPNLVTDLPADSVRALDQALGRWARRTDRRLSLLHRWLPRSLLRRSAHWQR